MSGFSALVLWGLTTLGGPAAASPPDSTVGPGSTVPFVAQGRLLCGGAAAAMLERYWGARGVYAHHYAHLVDEEAGGIETRDLAQALQSRGYRVGVDRNDPEAVLTRLEAGVPSILLIGDRPGELHYVVLTAASPEKLVVHDPKLGPDRPWPRSDLLARWRTTGFWALSVLPDEPTAAGEGPLPLAPRAAESSGASVVHGAVESIRTGNYEAARAAAHRILERGGADTVVARRILATAAYRAGDVDRALDEWNAISEPEIDLVELRGARHSRFGPLTHQLDLEPGTLLSSDGLALARRRLEDVPSVRASRVDYRPLPDGSVELRANVVEESRWPTRPDLLGEALRALLVEEVRLSSGPHFGAGDRWSVGGGWSPAQRHLGASLSTPVTHFRGVVTVGIDWTRELHAIPPAGASTAAVAEERLAGGISARHWATPSLLLGAGLALERWSGDDHVFAGRASATTALDGLELRGDVEGWLTEGGLLSRSTFAASLSAPFGEHQQLRLRTGATLTSEGAPRTLWPGAGTGRLRDPLLRGSPLVANGRIAGPAFAPGLVHATAEHRVSLWRTGPLRVGAAAFLDAAHTFRSPAGASGRGFVDPGVGAFVAAHEREAMLSLARGDSGWVLSAKVVSRP